MNIKEISKYTAILLFIVFAFLALEPLTVSAQAPPPPEAQGVTTVLIGGISCSAGGILAPWLAGKITDALSKLTGVLTGKIKKFLDLQLVVPVSDHEAYKKERIFDVAARCFAREILSDMTGRMIGAVRTSGRNNTGSRNDPAFVRDWRRFLQTAQYRGENIFRSVLSSTPMCPYFSNSLKSVFGASGKPAGNFNSRINNLDPFTRRGACTMPQGWTMQKYTNDFVGNGGWEALNRLAEPQNNFYGALLMSMGELAAQRAHEEQSDIQEAGPTGFTARRGSTRDKSCALAASNGQCIVFKDILTPGSVLQQSVSSVLNSELSWITNVDELNELVSSLTRLVMNRMLNLATPDYTPQETYPPEAYPGFTNDPDIPDTVIPDLPGQPECNDGIDNDGDGLVDYPDDTSCVDINGPREDGSIPPPPPPTGGVCKDPGNTSPRYSSQLRTAINTVIANNPGGIMDQTNTPGNAAGFFNYVITELQKVSLQGTATVLNGNDNPSSGDLFAVWTSGDTLVDRYDAIRGNGPPATLRTEVYTSPIFTGQIPASCANGGGGPPPPPPPPPNGNNVLYSGQSLYPGQAMKSLNGRFSFDLDTGGNLILYDTSTAPSTVLWTSGTSGNPTSLDMDVDGNLILYFDGGVTVAWTSGTGGNPGAVLDLANNGDVVIYFGIGGPFIKKVAP